MTTSVEARVVLRPLGRRARVPRLAKDALDRGLAAAALLVLLPLLLLLGLAVVLTSPGPALFAQERVGLDGRTFRLWKLRSMCRDAEDLLPAVAHLNEVDGPLFKVRCDPRVTRLGRVLRRWSLDELPQLWNVVRGDMSLVGPRPALPREVVQYDRSAARRLAVKPGLTGLGQVSGRSGLTWERTVELDLHYVDRWSLALDLQVLARTVVQVARRSGAW